MSRHLADKRVPSNGGRVKQFLRLSREGGDEFWRRMSRARPAPKGGRRVAEFARIERGHQT